MSEYSISIFYIVKPHLHPFVIKNINTFDPFKCKFLLTCFRDFPFEVDLLCFSDQHFCDNINRGRRRKLQSNKSLKKYEPNLGTLMYIVRYVKD